MIIQMLKILRGLHQDNSRHRRNKHKKRGKIKQVSFPNKLVENTDLYKPVLNKIMTTHEKFL